MPRYKLRTLLIVLGIGPMVLAFAWRIAEGYQPDPVIAAMASLIVMLLAVIAYWPHIVRKCVFVPRLRFQTRDLLWIVANDALLLWAAWAFYRMGDWLGVGLFIVGAVFGTIFLSISRKSATLSRP
jgi:small basic protein